MWDILNSFSFTFLTASFSDLVDFDIQNTESFPLDAFSYRGFYVFITDDYRLVIIGDLGANFPVFSL